MRRRRGLGVEKGREGKGMEWGEESMHTLRGRIQRTYLMLKPAQPAS